MIFYTAGEKREKIIVDDELAYKLENKTIYCYGNIVYVLKDGRKRGLGKLLFGQGYRRIDTTIHDYRKTNMKRCNTANYRGVVKEKKTSKRYYSGVVTIDKRQRRVPGFFLNEKDAAIVREAYIIKNNIKNVVRNTIKIGRRELNEEEILVQAEYLMKEYDEYLINIKERIRSRENYGIYKRGNRYIAVIRGKHVGSTLTIKACKCLRNLYIIDNNLHDESLHDLNMTVEQQREYLNEHDKIQSAGAHKRVTRPCRQYRGTSKSHAGYVAMCRQDGNRIYIGEGKTQEEAAMMYNIYTFMNGLSNHIVNDIGGYTLEEQLQILEERGYYPTERYRFKKLKK